MLNHNMILNHIDDIFGQDMHAKRVHSLANATLGVIESGSLAIHAIGNGLALANGLERKHAVKQVDRLLTNTKLNIWKLFDDWVPYVVAERTEIVVSMDWTEFEADDHSTLVISLQTHHGRNTPLLWKTHQKSQLKGQRNAHERELLTRLKHALPEGVFVTVVADRGFGYMELFERLEQELGFAYVIRFKANILVGYPGMEQAPASDWLTPTGRTRTLKEVELTAQRQQVERVYCCHKPGMKEPWFLASNRTDLSAAKALQLYGQRWGIESSFRDIKDYKFGMGMGEVRISNPARRDRLFLFSALAIVLLTLLGKAGDSAGLEKTIKVNTSKTRTYSFFRQGVIYYQLLPRMKEAYAVLLMEKFIYYLKQHRLYTSTLGII
ncbi:IS4 family transposase [Salmonella enterica subsp. enterica serovar Moero]|nr:IS4 family transposase [Salmonella enterica subsp. enterica serovar Moero]ECD5189167.1 IS4 family transposase [Salmonella enterica subsp. enterica serovar Moero]